MDVASDLYQKGISPPFSIYAKEQTQGRGRRGRTWESPQGNIYATFVLSCSPRLFHLSPFAAVLGLHCALLNVAGPADPKTIHHPKREDFHSLLTLKWPNDLLLNGKKIAGILLEVLEIKQDSVILSLGIGVNTSSSPLHVLYPTTNLKDEGVMIPNESLMECLGHCLLDSFSFLENGGWPSLRRKWISLHDPKHSLIHLQQEEQRIKGTFMDLDTNGHLVLETDDGTIKSFATGDVFFAGSSASA